MQRIGMMIVVMDKSDEFSMKSSGSKINQAICLTAFLLYAFMFVFSDSIRTVGIVVPNAVRGIIGIVLLTGIILCSVRMPLKRQQYRLILPAWLLCGLLVILTGMHHNIAYSTVISAIAMVTVFPLLSFVWASRGNYSRLFDIYATAFSVVMIFSFFGFMFFAPPSGSFDSMMRYCATLHDPNVLGGICLAAFSCSSYLFMCKEKPSYLGLIASGISFGICFYTSFRTALLSMFLQVSLIIILMLKRYHYHQNDRKARKRILKKLVCFGMTLALSIPFCYGTLIVGAEKISKLTHVTGESYVRHSGKGNEDYQMGDLVGKVEADFKPVEGQDYSNARFAIWGTYLKELNLIGNEYVEPLYVKKLYANMIAHNDYLEYAYRCGIPVGLLYLMIAVYAGINVLKIIFRKMAPADGEVFFGVSVTAYCVASMLNNAFLPLSGPVTFTYFIAMGILFFQGSKKIEVDA